ncbi:MAG: hypothetical protein LBS28_05385 [Streptococcaceae bacterium]|jgi:hypothetical protein|nr:hypothetical protein [Streptococcaceae bacterium]
MKKFFMGLMLSCVAMFSFSVVGNCMTQQTKKSAYLTIEENNWFKLEVQQQIHVNHYITLQDNWHQKIVAPSKGIVERKPEKPAETPSILIKEVLQEPKNFNLYIPITEEEDGVLKFQLASFNVNLKNSDKSIEEMLRVIAKPKKIEVKFMNVVVLGKTYEDEIIAMEQKERDEIIAMEPEEGKEPGLRIADLPFNLKNHDLKIIPVNLNFGSGAWGYILTPNLDAPLEKAVIWFTHVPPRYERKQFYNLKTFLDSYWQIKLKVRNSSRRYR